MERSTLVRLPPELRNHVYYETFCSRFAVSMESGDIQHPLTKTCRQIRFESLQLYYNVTKFNAYLRDGPIQPLLSWLTTIGATTLLMVHEIRVWDMHHNVLTLLSPDAGLDLLACSHEEGIERSLPATCTPIGENALNSAHRQQLCSTMDSLGIGARQLRERRYASAIVHHTSTYVLSATLETD